MPELIGEDVLYRRWPARPEASSARAVFLLVHGVGAQSARWAFLGKSFADDGWPCYAPELRGYGLTPDRPRGHVASLRVWERDILALRETIAAENPGRKILVLGESVGGLVAFNAACRFPDAFDGLVLISPDFKNGLRFPISAYLALALLPFQPKRTISIPFNSAMCTRDVAYQAVLDADPGELRAGSLSTMMSILSEQGKARKMASRMSLPVLFLISGTDHLVDERAGRRLFAKLAAAADKTILEYPEMLHALSIDLGRERVFGDILDWAGRRL